MSELVFGKDVKLFRLFAIFAASVLAWIFLKPVSGLSEQALHMIIIFVASMLGIMLEVCPPVVFLLISMLVANLTGTIVAKDGFTGFCNTVPWLLFLVLSLSSAITKTSLGMRLAYIFMRYFGKGITGLSYSIILIELFVAPLLPSNTARAASVGYPLVTSLSEYISSRVAGISKKAIGAYLSILYSSSNAVCSAMFLTAMISNAIVVESMAAVGINTTWISWTSYAIVPGLLILLVIPFVIRLLCHPKANNLGDIQGQAAKNYSELGPLTIHEKFIISVFGAMLLMWIFADSIGIPIFVTTLLGVCVFLFLGLIDVKDMLSNYNTFNSVIMLGILISYVNCLSSLGAIDWFNSVISGSISGYSPRSAFLLLSVIYFFAHYFFTGEGSRIIALYASFLATGLGLGVDKLAVAMTLAVFSSMSSVLTNYAGPVALLMFSTGYSSSRKWALCGFVLALVIMAIWFSYIFCIAA